MKRAVTEVWLLTVNYNIFAKYVKVVITASENGFTFSRKRAETAEMKHDERLIFMTNQRKPRSGAKNAKNAKNQSGRKPRNSGRKPSKSRAKYIDPARFVNRAKPVEKVEYTAENKFENFPFSDALLENVREKGYKTPSAIQDQSIPAIISGRDLIGLANTGTGKTAAFLLPLIHGLQNENLRQSVLILTPTRELAEQIDAEFKAFAKNLKLYSVVLVGGANIGRQIRELARRPHVIVATPGRAIDLMKRGDLTLKWVKNLVLDEADRMLDMGFIGNIREMARNIPAHRTLFFSATMTPEIRELTKEFLNDPEIVSVRTSETSENVDQDVIVAQSKEEKIAKLQEMFAGDDFEKVLLFGETKFGVQRLSDKLNNLGFTSVAIHGNKSQSQRQRALRDFKDNKARILVATDVAARGIDIPNVSHVINFDQPATFEDYTHRIGRTGRGGATGKALTFVAPKKENQRKVPQKFAKNHKKA